MDADMDKARWTAVDEYIAEKLLRQDSALEAALAANREAQLPLIEVAPNQGKLLQMIARMQGARRILEIGTLGGYSTIWLARALPADGRLITLELEEKHARVARENVRAAGLAEKVEIRVGPALTTLAEMGARGEPAFDLIFIDADKPNNAAYLEWAVRLARVGSVIVCDNVVREGAVIDAGNTEERVQGSRRLFDAMAAHPRLDGTALQTVGSKGYDGFAMALVTG